ncbi:MAG: DUF3857 domain-containing protein [Pseudomonadota bacterium]|nr:DUF3857 domain-containing protein [Pseudomonadota bacterium]
MRVFGVLGLALALASGADGVAQSERTPPPLPTEAEFAPAPAFVESAELIDPRRAQFEPFGGTRYLLVDDQHDTRTDTPVHYRRRAIYVENVTGVTEAASFETMFNPAFQSIQFHHIRVIREGEVEDRTDRTSIEFARMETERDRQILNGEATVLIRLDDVRVGDVVDYAYTITGNNPTFAGHDFKQFNLNYGIPIEALKVRSIWNRDDVGFWDVWTGQSDEIEEVVTQYEHEFRLNAQGRDSIDYERGAPVWVNQYPTLRVSSFGDWEAVASWGRPLFELDVPAEVVELADRFRREHDRPEDQLIAALRFVQDEIRYLALTYGQGGYEPATPTETLEYRYGDCKAKTVLFVQLARELGFDAHAAFVSLGFGRGIDGFSPSPGAFDHVIVRVMHEGRSIWVDPTQSQQGGRLDTLVQADYGWALPLDGQTESLVDMSLSAPQGTEPTTVVNEVIDISAGLGEPVTLTVETVFTGVDADSMRYQVASVGRSGLQRSYLDFYNRTFGEAEHVERMRIEDDRDANRLVISENVWLGSPYEPSADGTYESFVFFAHSLSAIVDSESDRRRDYPLAVAHRAHARHTVEMRLSNRGLGWNLPDERTVLENDAFTFTLQTRFRGDTYRLEFERESAAHTVAPGPALEALREHEDMLNALYYGVEIPTPNPNFLTGKPGK